MEELVETTIETIRQACASHVPCDTRLAQRPMFAGLPTRLARSARRTHVRLAQPLVRPIAKRIICAATIQLGTPDQTLLVGPDHRCSREYSRYAGQLRLPSHHAWQRTTPPSHPITSGPCATRSNKSLRPQPCFCWECVVTWPRVISTSVIPPWPIAMDGNWVMQPWPHCKTWNRRQLARILRCAGIRGTRWQCGNTSHESCRSTCKRYAPDVPLAVKAWPAADELERQRLACTDRALEERLRRRRDIRRGIGDGDSYQITIYAWRIGDAVLVGSCCEPYSFLQQELRHRFADSTLICMNLINGSIGYLPPAALYDAMSIPSGRPLLNVAVWSAS